MKIVVCKHKGTGHLVNLPDPKVDEVYQVKRTHISDKLCIFNGQRSLIYYTLDRMQPYAFSSLLFEEITISEVLP